MEQVVYSVSQINQYIKHLLTNDEQLKFIYIKGEISNYKPSSNGHIYFSIKDDKSILNAVMFNNYASKINFDPKNGDEVIVLASIDTYVPRGTYNLIIYEMNNYGIGKALLELEALKKKLASEGLFDETRKRKINRYPNAIGLITAPNSAALKDLTYNLSRRYPLADIYFFPSLVQGEAAPSSLLDALKRAEQYELDTLIIARGGGSNEDLSAFNDEQVVREAAKSKCPIISAVGHEIDMTLIDYVSDLRASTPTGAVELATVDINELKDKLSTYKSQSKSFLLDKLERNELYLSNYKENFNSLLSNKVNEYDLHLNHLKNQLELLSPKKVIQRGYSYLTNENHQDIKSVKKIKPNETIYIHLADGSLKEEVKEIYEGK